METIATEAVAEAVTEVIEVIEAIDYSPVLEEISAHASLTADASVLIAGMLLFFVVVVLC